MASTSSGSLEFLNVAVSCVFWKRFLNPSSNIEFNSFFVIAESPEQQNFKRYCKVHLRKKKNEINMKGHKH